MKKEIDEILKQALAPTEEPDFWLNQRILNEERERTTMKRRNTKRIPAVILASALVIGVGSVSAYAAWKYLTPENVAEKMDDKGLADAFTEENAVVINEKQSYGGYQVTLLGVISGSKLSDYAEEGGLSEDKTYSVVAIEKQDGTPMAEIKDDGYGKTDFFVSPLIKGYNPNRYNVATMGGGYSDIVENGVLYRLSVCDNVEIFADHKLYLCVEDATFYQEKGYIYDEATGEISRNENYDGLNALFELPLDESRADADAAAAYLEQMELAEAEEAEIEKTEVVEWMEKITPENIDEYAIRVESTVKVITPNEKGEIPYSYEIEDRGGATGIAYVNDLFPEGELGMCERISYAYSDMDTLVMDTFTLNEDGTVTFAAYIPK